MEKTVENFSFFSLWTNSEKFGPVLGKIGFISGVIALVVTILLALPQFIKVIKERKTDKGVNFTSFWIYNTGLLLWIIFASFMPGGLVPPLVANISSILLYSVMIFFLYYYKEWSSEEAKKSGLLKVGLILGAKCLFGAILSALWLSDQFGGTTILPVITQNWLQIVFSIFIPTLTALAFMPQIIQSFKAKSFQGVSLIFSLAAFVNNAVWWMYWFVAGLGLGFSVGSILTLTWQTVAIVIFLIQFTGSLVYANKKQVAM